MIIAGRVALSWRKRHTQTLGDNTRMAQASKFSESYPHGIDYEWYATDAVGHVAVCTTAGIGLIPVVILADLSATDSLINTVQCLPARGRATMLISLPRPDDFIRFASSGLFAYDWQDVHRTRNFSGRYEMISFPDNPIHLTEFPEQFHPLLRSTTLPDIRFADSPNIDLREYFSCEPTA